jgi:hypothetical protein
MTGMSREVAVVVLLVIGVLAGCAGSLEPGRLPTAEERCAIQAGTYLGGICRTRGGP